MCHVQRKSKIRVRFFFSSTRRRHPTMYIARQCPRRLKPFVRWAVTTVSTETTGLDPPKVQAPMKIKLRNTPFTSRKKDYLALPQDTFPNPLFTMSRDEILQLKKAEYLHLLRIPYRAPEEQSLFCENLIQILDETIIDNPKNCAYLIQGLEDSVLKDTVSSALRQRFKENNVKLSIYEYIADPGSDQFRRLFLDNIRGISQLAEQKQNVLRNYLRALVQTGIMNHKRPILLNIKMYLLLIAMTPPTRFHELYLCLFHINAQTKDIRKIERLKKTLNNGSPLEKFVMRTGWMDPKWHETLTTKFKEDHKRQMVSFFTVSDLKVLAETFVKRNDIINANIYLNLLVSKLEHKTNQMASKSYVLDGDSPLNSDINTIIEVALQYFMTFKSPTSCLKILKYMNKNNLKVSFKVFHIIIKQLVKQNHFQEALMTINSIPLNELSATERHELAEEILILVKKQFPNIPEVMVGYIAAIMGKPALILLNDLHLLGITYGNGHFGRILLLDQIKSANIDERLTGFNMTANTLANYYEILLHSVHENLSVDDICKLFDIYMAQAMDKDKQFPTVNDRVVYHLINFLLRKSPGSQDFNLHDSRERMIAAKQIFYKFTQEFKLRRLEISKSTFDLLIYASLMVHKDFTFAADVIKYSRLRHVPFTFNQIYPFIHYHYSREEYDRAHIWYKELVKHAVVATAAPAKELFRIARELNWEVTGFVFKKFRIQNNQKARKQLENVRMDSLSFFSDMQKETDIDDEELNLVTHELIKAGSIEPDFVSDLQEILYANQLNEIH